MRTVQQRLAERRRQMAARQGLVMGNPESSLLDDLRAYWKLDELSGYRMDVTGRGNHLEPVNNPASVPGVIENAVSFTAASSQYLNVADNDHLHLEDQDFSLAAWVNFTSLGVMNVIAKLGSTTGDYQLYLLGDGRLYFDLYSALGKQGGVIAEDFGTLSTGTWYHVVLRYRASPRTACITVNDITSRAAVGGFVGGTENPLRLGGRNGTPLYPLNGILDEVGFWRRWLDDAEVEWLYYGGWGLAHPFYIAPRRARSQVVCEGNSLTLGVGATPGVDDYPTQLNQLLGVGWRRRNLGVSGQTTPQMSATAARKVDGYLSALRPHSVVAAWEMTNDLYFGASAASAFDAYAAYCQARRDAGWQVVALSVLPRSNPGTPGDFEANRQLVNASLRQGWSSFADALADVAADERIGDPGDELDTTYYADRVHMTAGGYAIVAQAVEQAVLGLPA